jgi:hypothetical protein
MGHAILPVDEHNISPHNFIIRDEIVWRRRVGSGKIEPLGPTLSAGNEKRLIS